MDQREKLVYVPHNEGVWAPARVLKALGDGKFEVSLLGVEDGEAREAGGACAGRVEVVDASGLDGGSLPLQNELPEEGVEDMIQLNHLHEPAILSNLRSRFFSGHPYTYTGEIVIAVNPYRWLDIYSQEVSDRYAGMKVGHRQTQEPHVYSTSAIAYGGIRDEGADQSILVSGESGAGKTETVKILLSHLASLGSSGGAGGVEFGPGGVLKTIIQSNPLLESFGNAKTLRNDNSSRFGKFTRLQFSHKSEMVGSKCTTYLLEKSRVVSHGPGERGYHIFYQMCAATSMNSEWGLASKKAADFVYLTADGSEAEAVIEGKSDGERFNVTWEALLLLGLSEDELRDLFCSLAGILFLGQVPFVANAVDDESSCKCSDSQTLNALSSVARLLQVDSVDDLESSMIFRTVKARGETIKTPNSPVAATAVRDAAAKAIYACCFGWLVKRINASTCTEDSGRGHINLLDIFGFERFEINRFEQLMINYANEKLQQKFTQDVFKSLIAEYEAEGVCCLDISYPDNSEVLWLIESTTGVLAILDEECIIPRGSDERFSSKLGNLHEGHPSFSKPKITSLDVPSFSIQHYAGHVTYSAGGFLERNRDKIGEIGPLLAKSGSSILRSFESLNPTPSARTTISSTFKTDLNELISVISKTAVHYVRAIKPNRAKSPLSLENKSVVEQLRCAGVIEAIRISRAAFPNRLKHHQFYSRFRLIRPEAADAESLREGLIKGNYITSDGFRWGKTRIYFTAGTLEALDDVRLGIQQAASVKIQSVLRGWHCASRYRLTRSRSVAIQAQWRRASAQARFLRMRHKAIALQAWWRGLVALAVVQEMRKNKASSTIAATWLMHMSKRRYLEKRSAAITLQAAWRMAAARKDYFVSLEEYREAQKLENQIAALQARLKAEQEARVKMEEELQLARSMGSGDLTEVANAVSAQVKKAEAPAFDDAQFGAMLQESQEIIFALRAEVQKLKHQNDELQYEVADLKREKHKSAFSAEASGISAAAATQTIRRLGATNRQLTKELASSKTECEKLLETIHNKSSEQKALRLLLDSEMLMRSNQLKCMETMVLILARSEPPISFDRKDQLVHELNSIYSSCLRAETDISQIMLEDQGRESPSKAKGVFNQIRNFTASFTTPLRGGR